jgi:mRNA interferase MazF
VVALMKRGEIWVANLNPPRGREIGKIRPVVIMQADELGAEVTPMVVVLPLSTQVYPEFKRWRVSVLARGRLLRDCQVITDQPRTLDRARLGEGPLATLAPEEMAAVEKSLGTVLGLF